MQPQPTARPRRRPWAILLAGVAAIALLAACGDAESDDAEPDAAAADTDDTQEADEQASEEAAPADEGEPVELELLYPIQVGGPIAQLIDDLVEEFEQEHPNITVNAVFSGDYADTATRVRSAAEAGSPPDLAILVANELFTFKEAGLLAPIDDLIETEEQQAWLDSFSEGFMLNSRDGDGTTWAIPFQRSTVLQFHNKEAFEAAGLDPEAPPATWDELVEMGQAVMDADATAWGVEIPSSIGVAGWLFNALAIQNGASLVNDDGTETFLDDPRVVEALEFQIALSEEHGVMRSGVIEWGTSPENFFQEQTAVIWNTSGNLGNIRDNAPFEYGVSMLPAGPEGRGTPTGGGNFYLLADTPEENQRAALTFVQWMTDPERLAEWSIATGYVAPVDAAYETEVMQAHAEENPEVLVARDQMTYAGLEFSTYEQGQAYIGIFEEALRAAIGGEQSAAEALAGAQSTIDGILAPFR